MQDLLPPTAAGLQLIQSYGPAGFRIAGQDYASHVLVLPEKTIPWNGEWSLDALQPLLGAVPTPEVVLLGTGTRHVRPPQALRMELKTREVGFDSMDTGAACRTFNVLLGEERRVAAVLLLPV